MSSPRGSPCIDLSITVTQAKKSEAEYQPKPASDLHFSRDLSDAVIAMKSHGFAEFSAKQILLRSATNVKTVSNIVPKCNRNVQTVNLKAALIHAMNTVSSEPALLITTGNSSQYQALHRGATKIYRG